MCAMQQTGSRDISNAAENPETEARTGRDAGAAQIAVGAADRAAHAAEGDPRHAGAHEQRHAVAVAVVAEGGAHVGLAGPAAALRRADVVAGPADTMSSLTHRSAADNAFKWREVGHLSCVETCC